MRDVEIAKPQLYIGCALTHAPGEFRDEVEHIKEKLEAEWNVMRFLGLDGGTPGDVYDKDINENIRQCDAFLAIADHPATGLGWELGVADERRTPTLVVAKLGANVTRLVTGAADRREHIVYERYITMSDIPELANTHLRPMVK